MRKAYALYQERCDRAGLVDFAEILLRAHELLRDTPALLAQVRPALALVSVGAGNRYGHPSPYVVARLLDGGAQVLRTDQVGTVVVRTDGRTIEVEADDERWVLPTASSRR